MKVTIVHHANKPIGKIYIAENNKVKTKKDFIDYIVDNIPKDNIQVMLALQRKFG